jgi:uncharacterized protein (TIGR02145 family)
MILTDASILECIALFNKYSNSAVPSNYSLPLSDEDKQEIIDNIYEAYSVYVSDDAKKVRFKSNKKYKGLRINFIKVIWKVLCRSLPLPILFEDYQVPTIPVEPPVNTSGDGGLYNWYAIRKTTLQSVDATEWGMLYNWYAAVYNTGGASIAPAGWHLPTIAEMVTLGNTIGGSTFGGKLKETGYVHWLSPNEGATDEYGFKAFGSGHREATSGTYVDFMNILQGWLSDVYGDPLYGTIWSLYSQYGLLSPTQFGYSGNYKAEGCAIRLIKDDADLGDGTLTDFDSNVYTTVKIGSQVWMAENFRCTHYNNGVAIPNIVNNTAWINDTGGARCVVGNDIPILAPNGWHVPTMDEFTTLITALGGVNTAGGHLKEVGTDNWTTPNTGADDTSKFTALGSGERNISNDYININEEGSFWNSTVPDISNYCNYLRLRYDNSLATLVNVTSADERATGFSVRLLKDSTTLTNGQSSIMTDYDGNRYPTICIGSQEWMAVNLFVQHYRNGVNIPIIDDFTDWINDTDGAMCWYDNIPYVPPIVDPGSTPQYYLMTDGVFIYRKGVRDGSFIIDVALTPLAFGGIEDTDWMNLETAI